MGKYTIHRSYDLRSPPKLTLPTLEMDSLSTMCTLHAAYIVRQIHNDGKLVEYDGTGTQIVDSSFHQRDPFP